MKLLLLDHHGKAALIGEALERGGFEVERNPLLSLGEGRFRARRDYEAVLVDSDSPHTVPPWKHPYCREAAKQGVPIVLYPHGGPPYLDYDGIHPLRLPISLQLVHGEGHAEIYRRIGHPLRTVVIGWSYCELRGPSPAPDRRESPSLLLAPIHPWADGKTIMPVYAAANERAYQAFLAHPAARKTVRLWGDKRSAGIYEDAPGIVYTDTSRPQLEQIDEADLVISNGTFGYTALARGKPTVLYGGEIPPMDDECKRVAVNYERYRDYLAYPADLASGPLDELYERDVSAWKDLFVGGPLDEDALCAAVESVRPNRSTRRALARLR